MTKQNIGALFTSFCAAALVSTAAHADEHAAKAAADHAKGKMPEASQCQNNNCKGHSDCKGLGNAACHGQNSCKGKGWVSAKDEKECAAKKGTWHAKK
jgi:hypothetical protein